MPSVPPHLSLTGRQWILARSRPLAANTDVVELLRRERGLLDESQLLSDPMLFAEMGRAVDRIRSAVERGETVGIFGDYDADGITGTAQLARYFRRHAVEPVVLLPHREHDGYGLKHASVDALRARGVTLIITVDTGIGAHESIEHARVHGVDVIVTDHHRPSQKVANQTPARQEKPPIGTQISPASAGESVRPPAFAVIHPTFPVEFPNPHLSGSGVAFMLLRALERDVPWPGIEEDFVLATIGTIGDLVPLTGENRLLVRSGLKLLTALPEGPLRQFTQSVQSGAAPLTSRDIAFRLVPRINASGRMADPMIALTALLEGGDALRTLHDLNASRQELTMSLAEKAQTMVSGTDLFLCLAHEQFTHGTIGLIASKLVEAYGRPSLVACVREGLCTASIRSIPGFDVSLALAHPDVSRHLTSFGGHSMAAGCTFEYRKMEEVRASLRARMEESGLTGDSLRPRLSIDAEIESGILTLPFASALKRLEPFGAMNEEPVFLLKNQHLSSLKRVGSAEKHLQCRIGHLKAIGFGLGSLAGQLDYPVDLAFTVNVNEWNGTNECQLVLKDVRWAGAS